MTSIFWILLLLVAIALFGGAIFAIGWFMLWYLVIGLVIGGLARLMVHDTDGLGLGKTAVIGAIGSIAGGWIANVANLAWILQILIAILLAALMIVLVNKQTSKG